jgi:hypothetical protein
VVVVLAGGLLECRTIVCFNAEGSAEGPGGGGPLPSRSAPSRTLPLQCVILNFAQNVCFFGQLPRGGGSLQNGHLLGGSLQIRQLLGGVLDQSQEGSHRAMVKDYQVSRSSSHDACSMKCSLGSCS